MESKIKILQEELGSKIDSEKQRPSARQKYGDLIAKTAKLICDKYIKNDEYWAQVKL
jgi:hypothetical protein